MPNDILPDDQKNLYNAGAWEIFWKNFLAGMARGLGGLVIQVVIFILLITVYAKLIMPRVAPLIELFEDAVDSLNQAQSQQTNVDQLMQILQTQPQTTQDSTTR